MPMRDAHLGVRGPIVPIVWYDAPGSGPLIVIVEVPGGRWLPAYITAVEGRRVAIPVAPVGKDIVH